MVEIFSKLTLGVHGDTTDSLVDGFDNNLSIKLFKEKQFDP